MPYFQKLMSNYFFSSKWLGMVLLLFVCSGTQAAPLHEAARTGNTRQAETLLTQGARLEEKYEGRTPLYWAAQAGHLEMVQLLLKHGANPNAVADQDNGWTPLIIAAFRKRTAVVDYLLAHGANVNAQDYDGYSALAHAWEEGHTEIIKTLIHHSANVNAPIVESRKTGRTFLILALDAKKPELAKLLIMKGADLYARDRMGIMPLCGAAGYLDLVHLLIARGTRFDAKNHDGCIPLGYAVGSGNPEVVQLVLEHGAKTDINAIRKDVNGRTFLYDAIKKNHEEIARILIAHGADVNIPDIFGFTPLHLCARAGNTDLVRLLLGSGAKVNAKGKVVSMKGYLAMASFPGYTPLHAAVDGGNPEIVSLLLKHGANTQAEATGKIFTNIEIIRYQDLTPLGLAQLYVRKLDGQRSDLVPLLRR